MGTDINHLHNAIVNATFPKPIKRTQPIGLLATTDTLVELLLSDASSAYILMRCFNESNHQSAEELDNIRSISKQSYRSRTKFYDLVDELYTQKNADNYLYQSAFLDNFLDKIEKEITELNKGISEHCE